MPEEFKVVVVKGESGRIRCLGPKGLLTCFLIA